jgi:glutathione S-transferase
LWSIGTTRYTDEELLAQAREDLNALTYLLGDEHFIFGDEFHAVDAAVYGMLTQFYGMKLDTPLHQLGARYGSLQQYYKRISELLETKPPLKIASV